jgi:hypothetical protein
MQNEKKLIEEEETMLKEAGCGSFISNSSPMVIKPKSDPTKHHTMK